MKINFRLGTEIVACNINPVVISYKPSPRSNGWVFDFEVEFDINDSTWLIPYKLELTNGYKRRHISVPYFEIKMQEKFNFLIHALFVLDLNKCSKTDAIAHQVLSILAGHDFNVSDSDPLDDKLYVPPNGQLPKAEFFLFKHLFLCPDDHTILSSERQYEIVRFSNITFRKEVFLCHSEEWHIPYVNLNRQELFLDEIWPKKDRNIAHIMECEIREFAKASSCERRIIGGLTSYNIVPIPQHTINEFHASFCPDLDTFYNTDGIKSLKQRGVFQGSYQACLNVFADGSLFRKLKQRLNEKERREQKRRNAYESWKYLNRGWESDYFDTMGGNVGN